MVQRQQMGVVKGKRLREVMAEAYDPVARNPSAEEQREAAEKVYHEIFDLVEAILVAQVEKERSLLVEHIGIMLRRCAVCVSHGKFLEAREAFADGLHRLQIGFGLPLGPHTELDRIVDEQTAAMLMHVFPVATLKQLSQIPKPRVAATHTIGRRSVELLNSAMLRCGLTWAGEEEDE